jgi:hypothetical protein
MLTLGLDELFAWRVRLTIERAFRNISDAHQAIIQHVGEAADAGLCQQSHKQIATVLRRGERAVRDALKRGRALGLIDWQAQYVPRPGSVLRWRTANTYLRTMPHSSARARPDVRRHDGGTPRRTSREVMILAREPRRSAYERVEITLAAIAARREAQLNADWLRRRPP